MSTQAVMKARIASELRRDNITSQIASAISTAIDAYQGRRLFFNEDDTVSFSTVANQEYYSSSDSASLALLEKIDYVHLVISSQSFELSQVDKDWIDLASTNGTTSAQPYHYSWYNERLQLFPAPSSSAWTIRIGGMFKVAAPASDGEANNPWMTDAETLIRSHAKYELYTHVLMDERKSAIFNPDNPTGPTMSAFKRLKSRTARKTGTGIIVPWSF